MYRWRTDVCGRRHCCGGACGFFIGGWPHEVRANPHAAVQVPLSQAPLAPTFSRAGLDRIGDYIRTKSRTGKFPGAILLIQQHGSRSISVSACGIPLPGAADDADSFFPDLFDV